MKKEAGRYLGGFCWEGTDKSQRNVGIEIQAKLGLVKMIQRSECSASKACIVNVKARSSNVRCTHLLTNNSEYLRVAPRKLPILSTRSPVT